MSKKSAKNKTTGKSNRKPEPALPVTPAKNDKTIKNTPMAPPPETTPPPVPVKVVFSGNAISPETKAQVEAYIEKNLKKWTPGATYRAEVPTDEGKVLGSLTPSAATGRQFVDFKVHRIVG